MELPVVFPIIPTYNVGYNDDANDNIQPYCADKIVFISITLFFPHKTPVLQEG